MSRLARQLRRWPVIAAIVVVVIGGGSAAWAMSRSSGTNSSSQLVAAKVTTVKQMVSASGAIAPAHEADLDFAVSGRITHVLVKAGDKVKKGQPLARVGRVALEAQRAAAAATVTAGAAALSADSSGSPQATADAAALKAAKASLVTARKAVRAATLRATIAGTVTSVHLTRGQEVTGSGSGDGSSGSNGDSGGGSQVVVQSARSFIVNSTVDDTEISDVKKGQPVAVTPDGATFPVTGKVSSVSSVPSSSSGVVSFPIVVRLTGHPSGVYAGASAVLSITTKSVSNVLEIPTLAITYNGSTATVKVNNGSGAVTKTITVGENYGLETQVLSGIKAGDKVVVTIPTFSRLPAGGSNGGGGGFTQNFGGEGGGTVPGGSGTFPSGSNGGFGQ